MSCGSCGVKAFRGLRYKSDKSKNFHLCQWCFWRGRIPLEHRDDVFKEFNTFSKSSLSTYGGGSLKKSLQCLSGSKETHTLVVVFGMGGFNFGYLFQVGKPKLPSFQKWKLLSIWVGWFSLPLSPPCVAYPGIHPLILSSSNPKQTFTPMAISVNSSSSISLTQLMTQTPPSLSTI